IFRESKQREREREREGQRRRVQMKTVWKLNSGGIVGWTTTEPEKLVGVNQNIADQESSMAKSGLRIKYGRPTKATVIPARRKLVKRMIFDSIFYFIANLCCPEVNQLNRTNSCFKVIEMPKSPSAEKNKAKGIYPYPP
ncbi:hypothetical protein O6P43_015111, partial [Quillaja saponaria]